MSTLAMSRPKYGQRLLPVLIDELARHEPRKPWASLPLDDDDISRGYEDISYATFANAINKLAWLIESSVGRSTNFDTVGYLGASDIRYHMMQMALCKTGHKALFSSHQNTLPIHLSLMEDTDCKCLATSAEVDARGILAARPMPHIVIPELDELLDTSDVAEPYHYAKTYEQAAQDPYLIVHTSGTTGDPKPVVHNHAVGSATDAQHLLTDEGALSPWYAEHSGRFILAVPPYHASSSTAGMFMSVFSGGTLIPGFRHRSLDSKDICDVLRHARASTAILMPWMMELIAREPDAKDYMQSLKFVSVGGAVLSPFAGPAWVKHSRIQNIWGTSEHLIPPLMRAGNEDLEYVVFNVERAGIEFRKVVMEDYEGDGTSSTPLYEMVLTLTPASAPYATWHARLGITLESGPPYPEYHPGDLWTPHPDAEGHPGAWRFAGRLDDLVTFSTGVNLRPARMEAALAAHPDVHAAFVVGSRHMQPLALVELAEGVSATDAGDRIWASAIEPQNALVPVHGRVARTHLLVVPADGFVRTPKGNSSRGYTERKFAAEIEAVYQRFGDRWQSGGV
ncbi:acetyl-CoA synthetase-like protein [Xylariaceae sp. FL0804]|nr:acetyl-CoA synthetase-like protein [Xylariaceae sp. FL0804]